MLGRLDAVLTRGRVRNYSVAFLVAGSLGIALSIILGSFPLTATHQVFLPDFLAHWTGGRMLVDGRAGQLYDPTDQLRLQRHYVPGSQGIAWFVAPPFSALPYALLARLPYGASALIWLGITLALLAVSVRLTKSTFTAQQPALRRLLPLVFAASPGVFELVGSGQDTALLLVLWLLGIRLLMSERDLAGGAVLGLGLLKPQLFVFVPVVLVVRRQFRALASFTATGIALGAVSVLLVGFHGAVDWLAKLNSPLYLQEVQKGQAWKMQSVSALFTSLGAPQWTSWLFLAAAGALLAAALRRPSTDVRQAWALTGMTTVVVSPHVLSYDLVILLPAVAYLLSHHDMRSVRLLTAATLALGWAEGPVHALLQAAGRPWTAADVPLVVFPLLGLWLVMLRTVFSGGARHDPARSADRQALGEHSNPASIPARDPHRRSGRNPASGLPEPGGTD